MCLTEETESSHAGRSLQVHTAHSHYTSVDVLHAYCALAVVRHRLTQCTLSCCGRELTAHDAAGLCRLLLWDVDMTRRRCVEEMMYIHQLLQQRGLSASSTDQPACQQSSDPDAESSVSSAANNLSQFTDKSQTTLHDEHELPTLTKSNLVSHHDTTAVDSVDIVSDMESSSPDSQRCSEWQNLPVDVKYSQRQLSVELLQQEADRLHRLCDSISHCMVIALNEYCCIETSCCCLGLFYSNIAVL